MASRAGVSGFSRRGEETELAGSHTVECVYHFRMQQESPTQGQADAWSRHLELPSLQNYKPKKLFFIKYPVCGVQLQQQKTKTVYLHTVVKCTAPKMIQLSIKVSENVHDMLREGT
jgi:hypothetical protein